MTTSDAREVFSGLGLTYADALSNLLSLRKILSKTLKAYGVIGLSLKMTLRRGTSGDKKTQAYLRVDGPYFKDRECISFNANGFIGFAGWADSKNIAPILVAFCEWCHEISEQKARLA